MSEWVIECHSSASKSPWHDYVIHELKMARRRKTSSGRAWAYWQRIVCTKKWAMAGNRCTAAPFPEMCGRNITINIKVTIVRWTIKLNALYTLSQLYPLLTMINIFHYFDFFKLDNLKQLTVSTELLITAIDLNFHFTFLRIFFLHSITQNIVTECPKGRLETRPLKAFYLRTSGMTPSENFRIY